MLVFFYNLVLIASMMVLPHEARCSFTQAWNMPSLHAGEQALVYPRVVTGQAFCDGMYTYSYQYTVGDYTSPIYVGLGFGIDPKIEVTPPIDSEGETLYLWTEFKCLTCWHTSVYLDSAVVQDPD